MHAQISESLSAKKKVLTQETTLPNITINIYQLGVVDKFKHSGSKISSKLSLDTEELTVQPLLLLALEHVCGKTIKSHYQDKSISL